MVSNTPGAREAEGDIQQLTPTPENNTQAVGEQNLMHYGNEVTPRYPQRHASPAIAPLLNPSKSLLREAATAGLFAGLRTTASCEESSA